MATTSASTAILGNLGGTVALPAIKCQQGHGNGLLDCYVTTMRFADAARLIRGVDRYALAANVREARELALKERPASERFNRIPSFRRFKEIWDYIVRNEDYRFSALTVALGQPGTGGLDFAPLSQVLGLPVDPEADQIGILKFGLQDQLVVVDGQHRLGAIQRLMNSPEDAATFQNQGIPVVIFPYLSPEACQQLFSDLNRTAKKTSRSLDITYDRRDAINNLVRALVGESEGAPGLVPSFSGLVDFENVTVPTRSPQLLTVSVIYSASEPLIDWYMKSQGLAGKLRTPEVEAELLQPQGEVSEVLKHAWGGLFDRLPSWKEARTGKWGAEQRKERLDHISGVVNAYGLFLRDIVEELKGQDWRLALDEGLDTIGAVNWRRRELVAQRADGVPAVRECWQGIAMNGEQVIAPSNLKPNVRGLLRWLARMPAGSEGVQKLYDIFETRGRDAYTLPGRPA